MMMIARENHEMEMQSKRSVIADATAEKADKQSQQQPQQPQTEQNNGVLASSDGPNMPTGEPLTETATVVPSVSLEDRDNTLSSLPMDGDSSPSSEHQDPVFWRAKRLQMGMLRVRHEKIPCIWKEKFFVLTKSRIKR